MVSPTADVLERTFDSSDYEQRGLALQSEPSLLCLWWYLMVMVVVLVVVTVVVTII